MSDLTSANSSTEPHREPLDLAPKPYPEHLYPGCPCAACDRRNVMHLCPTCGNKRCPAASDHTRWACTGSNEPGQARTPIAPTPPTVSAPDLDAIRARVGKFAPGTLMGGVSDLLRDAPDEFGKGCVRYRRDAVRDAVQWAGQMAFRDVPALLAALDAAHAEIERLRKNRNECHRAEVHYLRRLTDVEAERDEARAALAAPREQYRDLDTYYPDLWPFSRPAPTDPKGTTR